MPVPVLVILNAPAITELIVKVLPEPILKLPLLVSVIPSVPVPDPVLGPLIVKLGAVVALKR